MSFTALRPTRTPAAALCHTEAVRARRAGHNSAVSSPAVGGAPAGTSVASSSVARAEIRLLGPVEVRLGDRAVLIGSQRQRSILGLLVTRVGRPVGADELIEDVWTGSPPRTAASALRVHIGALRSALASTDGQISIVQRGGGYALEADPQRIDAARFVSVVETSSDHSDPVARFEELVGAIGLWRGDPFDGMRTPLLDLETAHLQRLLADSLEERFGLALLIGRHHGEIEQINAACRAHPYRENFVEQHMRALYLSGRHADSLSVLHGFRQRLREDLGLSVGPSLDRLEQQILSHNVALPTHQPSPLEGAMTFSDWRPPFPASLRVLGGPLVGRQGERDRVGEHLQSLGRRDHGQWLLITGAAGIGKSRLTEEVAADAHACGYSVLHGWFSPDAADPYGGFSELFRSVFVEAPDALLRETFAPVTQALSMIVPAISFRSGLLESRPSAATTATRTQLFEAVYCAFELLAARHRLLVVLDDVHRADPDSLEVLRLLARRGLPPGMLAIVALRSSAGAAVNGFLSGLDRMTSSEHVELHGLDAHEAMHLVRTLRDATSAGAGKEGELSGHRLIELTAGVPLLIRSVASAKDLERNVLDGGPIPDTIAELLRPHLATLAPDCRDVLRRAAVAGSFSPELLESFGYEWGPVNDALETAIAADIVVASTAGRSPFRFRHELWRAVLAGELSEHDRRVAHSTIATFYESAGGRWLVEVAHHSRLAVPVVEPEVALQRALLAAERSLRIGGFETAAGIIEQALEIERERPQAMASTPCQRLLCDAKTLAGEAWAFTGDSVSSLRYFRLAFSEACELNDPARIARATLGTAAQGVAVLPDPERIAMLERALELVPDPVLRFRLQTALLEHSVPSDDWPAARELADAVVEGLRPLQETVALAEAIIVRARLHNGDVDLARLLGDAAEIRTLAAASEDPVAGLEALELSVMATLRSGNLVEADRILERYRRSSERYPRPWDLALTRSMSSALSLLRGDRDRARDDAEEALRIGRENEIADHEFVRATQRFIDAVFDHDLRTVADIANAGADAFPMIPAWRSALALVKASQGDRDEAARQIERVLTDLSRLSRKNFWLVALALGAEAIALLDRGDLAETAFELLAPYSNQLVVVSIGIASLGSVDHYAGLLAAIAGDLPEAERRLRNALAWSIAQQARTCEMDTSLRLAELLGRTPGGDADERRFLSTRARQLAVTMGFGGRHREAESLC